MEVTYPDTASDLTWLKPRALVELVEEEEMSWERRAGPDQEGP